jgi:hypothetical protein
MRRWRASLTPKMAIVQSCAPRHILYILVVLAGGAAAGVSTAACSMRDGSDNDPAPAARARRDESNRVPTPSQRPTPGQTPSQTDSNTPPSSESEPGSDLEPSGFHLDDPDVEYEVPRRPVRARKGRPIEIVLRSSPPGAIAAVDGVTIGPTPSLWQGAADASAREFTFVLPGYAIARYRFVPTQSGTVHATLEPIKLDAKETAGREKGAPKPRAEASPDRK